MTPVLSSTTYLSESPHPSRTVKRSSQRIRRMQRKSDVLFDESITPERTTADSTSEERKIMMVVFAMLIAFTLPAIVLFTYMIVSPEGI